MSPGNWGGYDALEGFAPLTDPYHRLVYSVHQYEPYEFTHEDAQLGMKAIDSVLDTIYSAITAIWLWEVTAADYHDFDVRFYSEVLQAMTAAWQQNTYYPSTQPPPS